MAYSHAAWSLMVAVERDRILDDKVSQAVAAICQGRSAKGRWPGLVSPVLHSPSLRTRLPSCATAAHPRHRHWRRHGHRNKSSHRHNHGRSVLLTCTITTRSIPTSEAAAATFATTGGACRPVQPTNHPHARTRGHGVVAACCNGLCCSGQIHGQTPLAGRAGGESTVAKFCDIRVMAPHYETATITRRELPQQVNV